MPMKKLQSLLTTGAIIGVCLFLLSTSAYSALAEDYRVTNQNEFWALSEKLRPGDNIILGNGIWTDFEIVFEGRGLADAPITLRAETPGEVIITGASNLALSGEYLVVSGLVFRDGYTPSQSVISFRKSKDELANNSRVTQTVIHNFTNPERFEADYWVAIYGKNNRFDHNHLEGKRNRGVTLAVRLDSESSRENYHRIDHNYFGPRPTLGSNGGETLRIGTSHFSRSNSFTTVENNYFDRCDGEVEIISSKSGSNVIRGNVFYESKGTLTLRHGHDNLVEQNVFLGNDVEHTGGIRVINRRQTIRNNYIEGVKGYRFGGALVVMNGVPNSPINRYDGVEDSVIASNSLIDSDHIQLAAGSDAERSAVPIRTSFDRNLIVQSKRTSDVFTVYDDISGISFRENVISGSDAPVRQGFSPEAVRLFTAENGLKYSTADDHENIGVRRDIKVVEKSSTGVDWYRKPEKSARFDIGSLVRVTPGKDTLFQGIKNAGTGGIVELAPGDYEVGKTIALEHAVTVRSQGLATITFERSALFEIKDGGSLKLSGVTISGVSAPDYAGNSVIRTSRNSMLDNYEVVIENSHFSDLDVNRFFDVLTGFKGTMADRITITDSTFSGVSGSVLKLDAETDDLGIYNADYVVISGSTFSDIQGSLVSLYRGGTDESTFGPHFKMTDSRVINVGKGSKNKSGASILLHGVQVTDIAGNAWNQSAPITINHTVGEPRTRVVNNQFETNNHLQIRELNSQKKSTAVVAGNRILVRK
ncbi:polysaccharide lyase 6 family protein [Luminiphilus sp.]|nr:polysaccharide lyase 6 family protein [Luminiphilus sp.]